MDMDAMREALAGAGRLADVRLWFLGEDQYDPQDDCGTIRYDFRGYTSKKDVSPMPKECSWAIMQDVHLDGEMGSADYTDGGELSAFRFVTKGRHTTSAFEDVGGLWAVEILSEGITETRIMEDDLGSGGYTIRTSPNRDVAEIGCWKLSLKDAKAAHAHLSKWLKQRGVK